MIKIERDVVQKYTLKKVAPGKPVTLKVVIYNLRGRVPGKQLYCKFFHNYRKHKTSTADSHQNPAWDEFFMLSHSVDRNSPFITFEVWGKSMVGKELKGAFKVDLMPILGGHEYFIDRYFDVQNANCELRLKILNVDALPQPQRSIGAQTALAENGVADPDRSLAALIDELKGTFPKVPYNTLIDVAKSQYWRREGAFGAVANMGNTQLKTAGARRRARNVMDTIGDPSDGWGSNQKQISRSDQDGQHMSYVQKQKNQKIEEIVAMLPDVDRTEIEHTLDENNGDLCRALDELILLHRSVPKEPEDNNAVLGKRFQTMNTTADSGGFMAVGGEDAGGDTKLLHCSMVTEKVKSGPGKDLFDTRRKLFESRSTGGKLPSGFTKTGFGARSLLPKPISAKSDSQQNASIPEDTQDQDMAQDDPGSYEE